MERAKRVNISFMAEFTPNQNTSTVEIKNKLMPYGISSLLNFNCCSILVRGLIRTNLRRRTKGDELTSLCSVSSVLMKGGTK